MVDPIASIREAAVAVARREDAELHTLTGGGVFDVPELAFSYLVGKDLVGRHQGSGPEDVEWDQERVLGNGGPTDLVFRAGGAKPLAVEFKVGGTWPSYVRDVEKLALLDPAGYERVFCALVDAFARDGASDVRIAKLETSCRGRIEVVGTPTVIPTRHARYAAPIVCVVGVWRLLPPARASQRTA